MELYSNVQKVLPFPFYRKPRQSGVSLKFPGLENIPQVPGNPFEVRQNYDLHKKDSATLTLKKKWGYISAHKLESERSKSFVVSILLQNKAIRT